MSNVQVLCPNGRRQNVKVNPNTKLLQVLEEVCKKQGFMPPEDFNLIHGRKAVDVTLSIRYANLPNMAKLELVKSETSRSEQDVLIALQLESGERLQNSFPPATTVWQILQHWENITDSPHKGILTQIDTSHNPPVQPTCIYMREEMIGELELQNTTLRKLGLTSGKAVIRLVHRPIDDATMVQISEKIAKEKAQVDKLNNLAKRQSSKDNSEQKSADPVTIPSDINDSSTSNVKSNNVCSTSNTSQSNTESNKSEPMEQEQSSENVSMETESSASSTVLMDVEMKADSDTGAKSKNEHQSGLQVANLSAPKSETTGSRPSQQQQQQQQDFAENIRQMNIPGLQVFTPNDFSELTPEEQQIARRLAAHYMPQLGLQSTQQQISNQGAKPKRKKPAQVVQPFADFKFPEETKGQDLYRNELSEVNKEEFKPCDRKAVLYSVEEVTRSSSSDNELPDDFFEVTENDVKKMYIDLQKKLKEDSEQPLMTRTMIQLKLEEKYSRYQQVIIRVQFPDKIVLQGLFRPRETVFAIQKFVKEHLEDKGQEFYLYTSPPKNVLTDRTMSLIEAKLAPASLVYFGSEVVKEHYLSAAVLKETGTKIKAEEIVEGVLSREEDRSQSSNDSQNDPKPGPSKPKKTNQAKSSQPDKDGKKSDVPKWFVMGKK